MKRFWRLTALLLAVLLLAAPVRAAYSDVPAKHWSYESISRATELGLVGGRSGDSFGFGRQVTRAEYALMLCRLMGWELISPETGSFADNQKPSKWYYSAIETACAHGVLPPIGTNIGPNEPLPREEMAAMTVRALGYASLAGVVQDDCPFTDVTTNPGYIALAYHMGLMGGVGRGAFAPQKAATREQAAAVLLRVYDRIHAELEQVTLAGSKSAPKDAVQAEPILDGSGRVPLAPRAPLERVYDAAVAAGPGGAVVIHTAPYNTTAGRTITQDDLSELLSRGATQVYRSSRYASSYLTNGRTLVWFETEEDIAEKAALCRLLGIKTLYLN